MSRYLIAGLGNPGKTYADTRHNIGFRCVDAVARAYGLSFSRVQHKALTADGLIAEKRVTLVKPQTFMNLSGQSVSGLVNFYKVPLDNLIVIYDDLDLPPGTVRLRKKGGAGGHKGGREDAQQHVETHQRWCGNPGIHWVIPPLHGRRSPP